jgi:mercuric ion transport protein
MIKLAAAVGGGLVAALGASLCCIGPLLAVFAGIGGAGLAGRFEPLRPYLLVASGLLFVFAAAALYRPSARGDRGRGPACEPGRRGRRRVAFWFAFGIAAILASFPWWSRLLV